VSVGGPKRSGQRFAWICDRARVYLIRRELYFTYRWNVSVEDVRELERQRIDGYPNFVGPKTNWL
jgi:hypothetical protein